MSLVEYNKPEGCCKAHWFSDGGRQIGVWIGGNDGWSWEEDEHAGASSVRICMNLMVAVYTGIIFQDIIISG